MNLLDSLIWMPSIIGLLIVCIFMHELGHYLWFRIYLKKRIKFDYRDLAIKVGKNKDYKKLSKREKIALYYIGIVWGIIPITFFATGVPFLWLVLIPYLAGCWTDIKLILENL